MISSYDSVVDDIWAKIVWEGSERRPTNSRLTFDNVCDAFYQAEHCPKSESCSNEVKLYRAEWNIHAYYFGEYSSFPGVDPSGSRAQASSHVPNGATESRSHLFIVNGCSYGNLPVADRNQPIPSTPQHQMPVPNDVAANRKILEDALYSRNPEYQVQFGWNPATGEPWFAVRSYAENSYPALYGPNRKVLHNVATLAPEFVLQFERFPHLGYTLMWPEFATPSDINNTGAWLRFNRFRAFLREWASKKGRVEMMDGCLKMFKNRPDEQKKGLALPDGFVLDHKLKTRVLGIPAPVRHIPPVGRVRRRNTNGVGREYTSGWNGYRPGDVGLRKPCWGGEERDGNEDKRLRISRH